MSKFWTADGDSTGSDSESDSEEEKNMGKTEFAGYGYESSSSEEEEKREVKSKKDKASEATRKILSALKNHKFNADWKGAYDDFNDLLKLCAKTKSEDDQKVLVKTICTLEDDIEGGAWADKKKLNKDQQRALTRLRQDIRKMTAPSGAFHDKCQDFRAQPQEESDFGEDSESESESSDDSDSSDDDSSDEDSDDEKKPSPKGKKQADSDDSDDSIDWASSEDSSDSDDDLPAGRAKCRENWLKKTTDVGQSDLLTVEDRRRIAQEREDAARERQRLKEAQQQAGPKKEEWTADQINKKLKEIIAGRGKRGVDRMESVRLLEELLLKVKTGSKKTEIMVHLISCLFDCNPNMLSFLHVDTWKKIAANILTLLTLLRENPEIILHESEVPETLDDVGVQVENEDGEIAPVTANLLGFLERLDDELNKSYQSLDPSLNEYLQRLKDEAVILEVARGIEEYYKSKDDMKSVASAARRRVEHLYWRTMAMARSGDAAKYDDFCEDFNDTCVLIYKQGDERTKTRVMLCQIFHYAQKGEFYRARDMLLMSHLQDTIQMSDIGTQILFNRTMVQLGLAAFVHGLITDAHNCLAEVLAGSRGKELLAQGLSSSRFAERNQEQEREEKRRQMPYHMHINLELLEFCHLTCAMLLEVPNMAEQNNATDLTRRRVISKPFRRTLEHLERQAFAGPPENTRDMVMHAAKALMRGDWQKCSTIILGQKCWSILPDSEQVQDIIKQKIQEEGLRTYLFTYAQNYDSLSLTQLSEMFTLENRVVHSIVSKMMINEELMACWDQPTNAIVMHQSEPSRLQTLALQFAEKASTFVENNEKLLDVRTGGYGFKYDKNKEGNDKRWENRDWDNNRNNNRRQYNQGGYHKGGYNNRNHYRNDRNHEDRGNRSYSERRW
jgi:translation initiation factor 3 subunit C